MYGREKREFESPQVALGNGCWGVNKQGLHEEHWPRGAGQSMSPATDISLSPHGLLPCVA